MKILNFAFLALFFTATIFISGCAQAPDEDAESADAVSYTLEVDVRIPKDVYEVGESLEGADYYLKYEGEPFEGRILYIQSKEGLIKKSYGSTRGTIKTGDFDNPKTIPGMKVSMYSVDSEGTPNPFVCDGTYIYTISVYDCKSIDDTLGTENCGEDATVRSMVNIDFEKIDKEVTPLKTASKTISVVCGDAENCPDPTRVCECISDRECKEGYKCEEYKCVLE